MTVTSANSIAIRTRNALQAAFRTITVANGYDITIALQSNDVLVGNWVDPENKKSFPYVHIGNLKTDYAGQHLPSHTDYPTITMDITAFVKDSIDREARADLLAVALCKAGMVEYTLGGLVWNSFYDSVETYEDTQTQGLGVVLISWRMKAQHPIGEING